MLYPADRRGQQALALTPFVLGVAMVGGVVAAPN
jgi:hypothetical protein